MGLEKKVEEKLCAIVESEAATREVVVLEARQQAVVSSNSLTNTIRLPRTSTRVMIKVCKRSSTTSGGTVSYEFLGKEY